MVVVAIVGVLATVAIVSLKKFVIGSKIVEATSMIQSIRVAQESWKGANGYYLNVSETLTNYYPVGVSELGETKRSFWQAAGTVEARWRLLNPTLPGPVQFTYAVVAGSPSTVATTMPVPSLPDPPAWPAPADQWYVIQAAGDPDANGVPSICASSSISDEVVCQDPVN